jgi:hypothetical protein
MHRRNGSTLAYDQEEEEYDDRRRRVSAIVLYPEGVQLPRLCVRSLWLRQFGVHGRIVRSIHCAQLFALCVIASTTRPGSKTLQPNSIIYRRSLLRYALRPSKYLLYQAAATEACILRLTVKGIQNLCFALLQTMTQVPGTSRAISFIIDDDSCHLPIMKGQGFTDSCAHGEGVATTRIRERTPLSLRHSTSLVQSAHLRSGM